MIEDCTFGSMTINGHNYTSDLIIFPDGRVMDNWWRAAGHRLTTDDIASLLEARPQLIVVGSGIYGGMHATAGLREMLARLGIELVVEPTEAAARTFNAVCKENKKVAGCFHLTC